MALENLPKRTRARDVEIDVLLSEAQRLTNELEQTISRISETVRTQQEQEQEQTDE